MLPQAFVHFSPWLVSLAILICFITGLTVFTVYSHLLAQLSNRRRIWLLLTGFCAGAGIWAAYFVAMLAYATGLGIGFNPWLMLAAFVTAVVIATTGFGVSLPRERLMIAMGGAIIGLGIAATQFLGMQALTAAGTFQWNFGLVAAAALLGPIMTTGALLAYREQTGWLALISGMVLFVGGVCALHYIAMAALTIVPVASPSGPIVDIDAPMLAATVSSTVAIALLGACAVALVDRRAARECVAQMIDLINTLAESVVIADNGIIVNMNAKTLELCGREADQLIGKKVYGDLLSSSRAGSRLRTTETVSHSETRVLRADGAIIRVEVVKRSLALTYGNEVYAIQDQREREEAARQLEHANEKLRHLEEGMRKHDLILADALSAMSQGLCMYDEEQRVVISNKRFATLYGLPEDAIQPGMSLREVVQKRIDHGVFAGTSARAYMQEHVAPVVQDQDFIDELNSGPVIAVARRPLRAGWVTTDEDVSDRRRLEERIERLANHDALTDLPSRKALRDLLDESLTKAARQDHRIAVLMLGIDKFSEIGDALGQEAGDTVMQLAAKRLQENSRRRTVLGRYSEDKFVMAEVVEHTGRDAEELASVLQEQISTPFALNETNVEVTTTVGISLFPTDGTDADTLLRNANLALHHARIEKPGSHRFFEAAMDRELRGKRTMKHDLAGALERREFELHYQPLVDLVRSEITGFEAFLRWKHPVRGLVPPGSFLPLAEEIGLINAIEGWTLLEACKQAVQWPRHITVAVNVSVSWFRSHDFIQSIVHTLNSTGLSADRLQIEVTEKVLHENANDTVAVLQQLFGLGVRVALDDFGAGFSSLTYLRQFPFHRIKIDRTFVAGLSEGEDSRVIIRTLARLGTGMRIATTAEGVETKEQFEIVRAEGCTEMQGYYFSPPKTAEEIGRLLLMKPLGRSDAVA